MENLSNDSNNDYKIVTVENISNDNNVENNDNVENCPICLDAINDNIITNCGHKYCFKCIISLLIHKNPKDLLACPLCVQNIQSITLDPQLIHKYIRQNKTDYTEDIDIVFCVKFLSALIIGGLTIAILGIIARGSMDISNILFFIILTCVCVFFIAIYILITIRRVRIIL